jgi:hypothetical protein
MTKTMRASCTLEFQQEAVRLVQGGQRIAKAVRLVAWRTRGAYGWPPAWKELLARGIRVSKEPFQKLMRPLGIRANASQVFCDSLKDCGMRLR